MKRPVVLDVAGLSVDFTTDDRPVPAVQGVSFQVERGEALGLVGESGAGKTSVALAILGLLGRSARVTGSVRVRGQELIGLGDAQISAARGRTVAIVLQDPANSLNPVQQVGGQVEEAILAHRRMSTDAARVEALRLLNLVGIPQAAQRMQAYPDELSGGLRQRVAIAIAMANDPDVVVADEPTTALDTTAQTQVLDALEAARRRTGAALVLVTHDLGVVAGHADRVGVMYAGRLVEIGEVDEVFSRPLMPYTRALMACQPRLDAEPRYPLPAIGGGPPTLTTGGCPFEPRCLMAEDRCRVESPALRPILGSDHRAACHLSERLATAAPMRPRTTDDPTPDATSSVPRPAVMAVRNLVKHFPVPATGIRRRRVGTLHAVCDISFDLEAGVTLGLVGESAAGKSTTARMLLNLVSPTAGEIRYGAHDLTALSRRQLRAVRRDIQIVFQDPSGCLDPRMPVFSLVAEPLRIDGQFRGHGPARVRELLSLVGLDPDVERRYPHEISAGQRQRVSIARALATNPKVVVLDEPLSALDASVQAGVVNLLIDLQQRLDLSYLFISHDLAIVRHIAARVAVMHLGVIVESAPTAALFRSPEHPYTQALISAAPVPDPPKERGRTRILLVGEPPDPTAPLSGCRFRGRCPTYAGRLSESERQRCAEETPQLVDRGGDHRTACHFPEPLGQL